MSIGDYRSIVESLRERGGSDRLFGAGATFGHRFDLYRPSRDEIAQLEEELGVELPPDFARFLLECGSGAGPYYGIFPPSRILEEFRALNEDLPSSSEPGNPGLDFALSKADAQLVVERILEDHPEPRLRAPWPADGAIPICDQGCGGYNVLVTARELRGTVWGVFENVDLAWWWPAERPVGVVQPGFKPRPLPPLAAPPSFREWYESWLERATVDLEDLSHDA
jgi:hypothetical protein